MPLGLYLVDRHYSKGSGLRHQPRRAGLPCSVVLRRRFALAGPDPGRQPCRHASLSARNQRLDWPAWRTDADAHHDARPGTDGALSGLSVNPAFAPRQGARSFAAAVVAELVRAYLIPMSKVLPETVAETATPFMRSWPILAASVLVALALAGTVLLWAHYGTTVFFETIRAGFAACFG